MQENSNQNHQENHSKYVPIFIASGLAMIVIVSLVISAYVTHLMPKNQKTAAETSKTVESEINSEEETSTEDSKEEDLMTTEDTLRNQTSNLSKLQMSQRDTQRKHELSRIQALLHDLHTKNPKSIDDIDAIELKEFSFIKSASGIRAYSPNDSNLENQGIDTVKYIGNSKCSGAKVVYSSSSSNYTISTKLENGSIYCLDV